MIKKIKAKTILSKLLKHDSWFGLTYNMNLYRGCQHNCIYCDSRSECYRIENFNDILVKENAIELLKKELSVKKLKGTIGFGSMNDCYMPIENDFQLSRKALQVIAQHNFPVHIITKSDLVLRDIDLLKKISKVYAAVSFSITTSDEKMAKKIEPGASSVKKRFAAIKKLNQNGIYSGICLMPILPFIQDNIENISRIVKIGAMHNAKYIVHSFGVTLRDRQKDYFFEKLDELYPGVVKKYIQKFGNNYGCMANNYKILEKKFKQLCKEKQINTKMKIFQNNKNIQKTLF